MTSLLSERYERLRPIGQGAGAQVFSVRDVVTDTKYAMKVAHVALAKHARVRNRWKREISMHARFEHPYIVPLFDYGTMDKGEPYIIMGLAQSAMDSEMKKGISIEQLFTWIEQILQGLGYLHSRNIIHQDFKTENVLINEDGDAWIIDFSIARSLSEIRIHSDEITGTMGWMAPEQQLKQNHHIGPWTDIYAVGKVFELLNYNIEDASPISHILESWTKKSPYERPASAADAITDVHLARQIAQKIYEETGIEWLQQKVIIKQLPPPLSMKEQKFLEIADESVFVKKELAQDVFEYRTSVFGQKNKMGGYKNPKLFLHRDPILYLWKDMKDQVVEELQSIYRNKSPQGMIFEGDSGSGASELIRSLSTELSACGLLDPVSLRYLKTNGQGGIYEALKEDIFPYGESIEQMLQRVQKQVQRYLAISPELAERQTKELARWCGIIEDKEVDIDSSMGLVFLFKKMAINSNRVGTCLSMFHPERTRILGDGLHIFSSILNQSVGRRCILILASVHVENQKEDSVDTIALEDLSTEKRSGSNEVNERRVNSSDFKQQNLSYIESLGAKKITLQPSFEDLKKLLQEYFLLESDIIPDVCAFSKGKIGNIVLLIRFWVAEGYLVYKDEKMILNISKSKAFPKNRKQLLLGRLAPVLRGLNKPKIPALTRLMILVSLLKIPPTELLLRQEDNEGLEEALALGLLRQRGKWIEFESEDYRSVILEHAKKFVDLSEYHIRLVSYLNRDTEKSNNPSQYIDIEQRKAIALHWLSAKKYDPGISLLCTVAENFFKIGLWQSSIDCAYSCLQFIREQRTDIQPKQLSADEIEAMWMPGDNSRHQQIEKVDLYNDHEQRMFMLLARSFLQNREYAQTWTWLRKCTLQTDKLQARALLMQAQLPRFLDHSLDYLRQAESIYRSYNDEMGVANTQYIRAQIFLEQGAYVQSQLLFQSIIDKISSNRNLWSLAFIGLIHSQYRRGGDVLKSVNSFIDEARKSGNIFSLSNASYFGAISYMRSRNWPESERIFYVALALASTGGLVRVQAEIFSGLATCKALQGNIQQARQCHQQSYILLRSHNLEEETEIAKLRWLCTFLLDKPFDVFRQHMDRFQPIQTRTVQLWWSLCKMLRHSMITDKQGTTHWWQKAQKTGLSQMWDMNVCFLLQAIVKSSKPHSPDISKKVLQEVQRIYRQNVQ